MTRRWSMIAVCVASCCIAVTVRSNTDDSELTQRGVYLNDSFESIEQLARAMRLAQARQWEAAAEAYHAIVEQFGRKLIADGENRYISVAHRANRALSRWPSEGLVVYRNRFEAAAEEKLREAVATMDAAALVSLSVSEWPTVAAGEALDLAGQIAFEQGAFLTAAQRWQHLLDEHPDGNGLRSAELVARSALAYAWAGDGSAAAKLMDRLADDFPNSTGRIGRQEGILLQLVKESAALAPPPAKAADDYWPTAGGGASRTRLIKSDAVASAKLWESSFTPSLLSGRININQQMGQRHKESGYLLAFSPVGADGILYFHDDQKVWAIRAASGHEVFTTPAASKQRELDRRPQYRHEPPPMFAPTLDGDRLYVRLRNGGRPAGRAPATSGATSVSYPG